MTQEIENAPLETPATVAPPFARLQRWAEHPIIKLGLPLLVLGVAIFVLHKLAGDVSPKRVVADISAASPKALLLALGATTLSYLAIAFYDVISLGAVAPGIVAPRVAYLVGGAGYAISNLLGVSYLTGGAVRLRTYVAAGVPFHRAALALGTSWSGFWTGLVALLGLLMMFHPKGLSAVLPIAPGLETATGVALIAGLGLTVQLGPSFGTFHLAVPRALAQDSGSHTDGDHTDGGQQKGKTGEAGHGSGGHEDDGTHEEGGGHGGASGRYQAMREVAEEYCFLLTVIT